MKNHGLRFFVIAAIAAVCVWLTLDKGIKLGLDLAGGSSLTYGVRTEEGQELDRQKLDRAIEVITKRVNATGLTEIFITSTATGQIVVEMPRRTTTEIQNVKSLIERNGQLEFRIVADQATTAREREKRDANPAIYRPKDLRWVPTTDEEAARAGPELLVKVPEDTLRRKYEALKAKSPDAPETREAEREWARMAEQEVFRGEDLKDVRLQMQGAELVVGFDFKDPRRNAFGDFTERNLKQQMAILLDGKVTSAPVIQSKLAGGGVIQGGGQGFKQEEANALRIVLESGSTGVQLFLEREETLGASLGEIAIERGEMSVLVGFIAVVGLIVWYYRVPGLVANFALLLNVVITLGAMAFFRGALSLPGIAGIVLGLGMSIDANILTFERLRDERKRGKSLQESLAAGYDNAMSAIIDGNITALICAGVLMWMGSGAVRGFGVTLAIGLLASMFTAVWVTRCIFEFAVDRGWMREFNIGRDPREPKLDYVRHRLKFTFPSVVLMVAGVVGFLSRDDVDAKDLEFIGGQQVIVHLKEPVGPAEIARVAKGGDDVRWEDATAVRLEPLGVKAAGDASNRWMVRAKAPSAEAGRAYVEYLRTALADRALRPPFSDWKETPSQPAGRARGSIVVHTLEPVADLAAVKKAVETAGLPGATVERAEGGDDRSFVVSAEVEGGETMLQERVRTALAATEPPVQLSDAFPSISFLSPVQAEKQWRAALQAVLVSLAFQIVYIRLRFADYTHGFAAAIALLHDVTIALGAVALFDALGLVYAKVNLVLIAAFLTLIGYSMNDTIVIFDRIRENLGRSKVIRSRTINDAINQTFSRSIRTSIIVFATVLVQFLFNRNQGSAIEGFAFVMTIGVIAGSYSTYFIAAPLLLFLPGYARRIAAAKRLVAAMCVATVVGALMMVAAKGHGVTLWVGALLAASIPLHFLAYFLPWLTHPDPDALLVDDAGTPDADAPLTTPGV